ncbi:MAG: endonuclease domain-containing protein [Alphaproteobacteria bacterium]|nr:endonuclease domain-containing protein [Alphaproteobacteria bacterium]
MRQRTQLARRLRRDSTEAERQIWRQLRELETGNRFRRQHPIGDHIVDFACPAAKLAIELDGGQHAINREEDEIRTQQIARHGYRVIRFWNGDVIENLAGVVQVIKQELEISLSALGGGEGRGEVGGTQGWTELPDGDAHLTLPVAPATGPLPLRPKGQRGER